MAEQSQPASDPTDGATRRDFLVYAASGLGAVGAAAAVWPSTHSRTPAPDPRALASTEVDISPVQVGQAITVTWRGKPVFISHRTADEIEAAQKVDVKELRDPQTDAQRVQKSEWLIMVGICTHLGCIPLGQKPADPKGE